MSMNLHCEEVELPQTSTVITNLCYYSDLEKRQVGRWQDIREKFILWYRHTGNASQDWETINKLCEALRSKGKLTFFVS